MYMQVHYKVLHAASTMHAWMRGTRRRGVSSSESPRESSMRAGRLLPRCRQEPSSCGASSSSVLTCTARRVSSNATCPELLRSLRSRSWGPPPLRCWTCSRPTSLRSNAIRGCCSAARRTCRRTTEPSASATRASVALGASGWSIFIGQSRRSSGFSRRRRSASPAYQWRECPRRRERK